ncbi:kinesin-like protein KIN-14S [Salvia divinorum]|uniref:Kinesin-like protein n=1 Tax=Salvia divinorum TaxID=28513 RepID=A0ABD1GPJ4_SALDI
MDDQALEILCSTFHQAITLSPCNADQTVDTPERNSGCEGNCNSVDTHASVTSDDSQEACSQSLPIFRKIESLTNKLQSIREEHARLSNEVKGISIDSLLGSEAFTALENLSVEHELLKNKYHEECELLKKKYLQECSERKKLYNEVIELKGNIRVFCRCRPLNQDDIEKGSTSVVDIDSSQENELQIICSDSSKKQFKFDRVFGPEDNQEAVFDQTMPIVTSVLDGYNVCIFAYGQTGTGKTYTMEGTSENRGVNYRTLKELFRTSRERSTIMRYELFVSMLEVYNEKIRDLLVENSNQPAKKLDIKQSAEGTQEVPGLVEARVYDTEGVWSLLKSGSQVRSVGSTNANEFSSRSHCLLRVTVAGENIINGQRTRSHLWLVDLAGSERVGRIEVEGERLKESQFINKSLSALGDVISALASKNSHVPYRNSKLTHMLQSSLGGDCKTLMFVQISPNSNDLGETLCSLNFASRVRGVEHGPARRQTDHAELLKYKQLAEKAKQDEKEAKKLQDNVQALQLRLAAREHICKNLQEKVRDLETQLAEERKTRLKQENRALASVATQSTLTANQVQKASTADNKKPPLAPSKLRLPLRRITNFMPAAPSPAPPNKKSMSMSYLPAVREDKENVSRENKGKQVLKARRGSIAVRPSPAGQVFQPKRRASSIAAFRPESNSSMATPLKNSSSRMMRTDRMMGRQSFVWDPQRVWRTSRASSPLPQSREVPTLEMEATPIGPRSSKFRGSPPSQVPGSWKPKYPTVVALQKKVVWSPLKLRGMKNKRNSFMS